MLKKRVHELVNRYEYGEVIYTAYDVCEDIENILNEEPWDESLSRPLKDAIDKFHIARHDYEWCHGHCDNGSGEFIEEVERIIGFKS